MDKIEFLKSLGFSEYESKTLSSLIKLNFATPKEISQDSSVPKNKLYAILKKFEEKGIVSLIPGEPKKYKLINFQTYVENKIKEKESSLKELKKDFKNLKVLPDKSEHFSFELIKGQQTIMNKLAEENKTAKKEIIGSQRNWRVWGTGLREMEKSIKKGIKVKLIGEINNETKKRAIEWKKTGCKIKAYDKKFGENPLRFTIIDNQKARITIGRPEIKDSKDYITIWTTSKSLILILRKQFDLMWKECRNF